MNCTYHAWSWSIHLSVDESYEPKVLISCLSHNLSISSFSGFPKSSTIFLALDFFVDGGKFNPFSPFFVDCPFTPVDGPFLDTGGNRDNKEDFGLLFSGQRQFKQRGFIRFNDASCNIRWLVPIPHHANARKSVFQGAQRATASFPEFRSACCQASRRRAGNQSLE